MESTLRLTGWSKERRVILVRESPARAPVAQAVTRTSSELHRIRTITERWTVGQRWTLLLTRLLRRWLGGKWLPGLPDEAALLLSG